MDRWWRELIAGRTTRGRVYARAAPWFESYGDSVTDPIVTSALAHLHSFALRTAGPDGRRFTAYRGAGAYMHGEAEVKAAYAAWRTR